MARQAANPFTPTFGSMPFALAGRTQLIDDVIEGLANRPGDPNRSTIFIGPRGSGKTVLLNTIAQEASEQGWVSVNVSAHPGMLEKIVTLGRENAAHLLSPKSNEAITSVQVGPVAFGREKRWEKTSWWLDVRHIVEDLNEQGVGLLVTIDEIDPECEELIDFIDTYQHFITESRDVALLMGGLPSKVSMLLMDEHVSFIRRAFQRPLGPIGQREVEEALHETIVSAGKQIEPDALAHAARASKGFAFAIQLVGYYLWRTAAGRDTITLDDAVAASELAQRELEFSIFIPTLREMSPREQQYVMAMAQDDGPSSTSDIAHRMGISMTNASNLRRRLITRGVIGEVRLGQVGFELPMLREFLRAQDAQAGLF